MTSATIRFPARRETINRYKTELPQRIKPGPDDPKRDRPLIFLAVVFFGSLLSLLVLLVYAILKWS